MALKHVDIYITHTVKGFVSDSAYYAYALVYKALPRYGYGVINQRVTQNSLLLTCMTETLSRMRYPCEITFYINSKYIANMFKSGRTQEWRRTGYKKADGNLVIDAPKWEVLLGNCEAHLIDIIYSSQHAFTEILNNGIERGEIFEDEISSQKAQ